MIVANLRHKIALEDAERGLLAARTGLEKRNFTGVCGF